MCSKMNLLKSKRSAFGLGSGNSQEKAGPAGLKMLGASPGTGYSFHSEDGGLRNLSEIARIRISNPGFPPWLTANKIIRPKIVQNPASFVTERYRRKSTPKAAITLIPREAHAWVFPKKNRVSLSRSELRCMCSLIRFVKPGSCFSTSAKNKSGR